MRLGRTVALYAATAVLATAVVAIVTPGGASAHGAMMKPGSRTYLCWQDGLTASGGLQPTNPACAAAVAQTGTTPLYNWFAVLRSDAGGRTTGYIPDGQLCSGGTGGPYDFTSYNAARDDWPVTHLTSGSTIEVDYSDWAKHPGTFYLYVTKDGYDPTKPLAWSDLDPAFSTTVNPPSIGGPGTNDGHYYWNVTLPQKSGRHIIYSRWVRSDSNENFFGCSDVVFDGGHGEVTGIRGSGDPSTQPSNPVSQGPSQGPSQGTSPSSGTGGPAGCSASLTVASSWSGGFQGNVTVTNTGSSAIGGWTVNWSFPGGQTISQVWSGTLTQSGSNETVKNVSWNGALNAKGSTTFGFIGSGSAPSGVTAACSAA